MVYVIRLLIGCSMPIFYVFGTHVLSRITNRNKMKLVLYVTVITLFTIPILTFNYFPLVSTCMYS